MNKVAINLIKGVKTLGINRKDMPQIDDLPGFLKNLKKDGVSHHKEIISPYGLKPTQNSIDSKKVDGFKDDVMNKPVVVAKGGHIVDGHHRWAKAVMDDKIDKLKVVKVDMNAKQLINKANDMTKAAFFDELQKIALHPLMEMSMAGGEIGSLVGAAIAIPVHKKGQLKNSLLEKAEIGGVTGAALTPITATILKKMKVLKW